MVEWLTIKHWSDLTEREVEQELENLLRNCETEEEFREECRHRFDASSVTVSWGEIGRSAAICRQGKNESIYTSVSLEEEWLST